MDAAVQTFSIHKRDVRRGQGLEEEDFIVGRVGAVGGGTPQMQARGWGELVARAHSDEDQDEENLLTRTRRTKRVYSHDIPPPSKRGGAAAASADAATALGGTYMRKSPCRHGARTPITYRRRRVQSKTQDAPASEGGARCHEAERSRRKASRNL